MSKNIKFGTEGWRAIIADEFTFANVELVTRAIVNYIRNTYSEDMPVLIAYDTRFMANKFALKAAEIVNSLGLNVLITDRDTPT
ncbi:MAG: phosphoglucomutase/phosphomannomutase family protein, partial [Cyanobacteriota bacterium]